MTRAEVCLDATKQPVLHTMRPISPLPTTLKRAILASTITGIRGMLVNLLERGPADDRPLVAANVVSNIQAPLVEKLGAAARICFVQHRRGAAQSSAEPRICELAWRAVYVHRSGLAQPGRRADHGARVRSFWENEFPGYFTGEVLSPIRNKVGAVLAAPALRNMRRQAASNLRITEAMDQNWNTSSRRMARRLRSIASCA